ncbi:CLUMA_CG019508, isoform A [Clunio marinus]|uniref:Hydroxylysine kinase n=1 Tax=Clunio marinus TaxID=568069 RepID=A0A1J1J5K1_9DIPT|nr:CLUMA_CG019508, isoform A [Clunio marinus]
MDKIDESTILKPGAKIKPQIDASVAKQYALKLYGIHALDVCELNSYDDRNFLIFADKSVKNPFIKNFCPHGYVLKFLNSFDSKKSAFIEGQTALSLYLSSQKVLCPRQLQNAQGKYYSLEGENIVRLYEYIPGKLLCDVTPTPNLFYQAGLYLGKLQATLKNFQHDGYTNYRTLWMMQSVSHFEEYVNIVNEANRGMVETIIKQFKERVLANIDQFPKQLIHGDFNEQNVLVEKSGNSADYKVIGFLDFGDTHYSPLLFDLAIALTYNMLITGEIATGGYFIAGYKMTRLIPESEMKILKLCVCLRLCQSLVLGLYTHQFDKSNNYLLTTQTIGWKLLEDLFSRTDAEVIDIWNEVSDDYLTQSYK